MRTLLQVSEIADIEVYDYLDKALSIPVLTGPQCQGDLILIPTDAVKADSRHIVTKPVELLKGNGGHAHSLIAAEGITCFSPRVTDQDLGYLTVSPDATAYLLHPEHGANGVGPGSYIVRRQREMADEIRLVQD